MQTLRKRSQLTNKSDEALDNNDRLTHQNLRWYGQCPTSCDTHMLRIPQYRYRQPNSFRDCFKLGFHLQGAAERGSRDDVPVCVSLASAGKPWVTDGIAVDSFLALQGGFTETACETYHLSPFALAVEEGLSVEWVAADLVPGAGVLRQVRA